MQERTRNKGFAGIPAGRQDYTPVPNLFLTEVLPDIDHLGELKVTLYLFWLLTQKTGERRFVSGEELAADARLTSSLGPSIRSPEEALREALDRAVARGSLLRVTTGELPAARDWYFANTEKGRQAVDDLLAGKWTPTESEQRHHLQSQRPNIFVLYEQNIGPLTPLLAEHLMEAEKTYPASWIEDAFREAVELNKRSWRYVQRILERWVAEGREGEKAQRADEQDWRRFLKGGYAKYVE
jgi:DnaD/phage-associated family protein